MRYLILCITFSVVAIAQPTVAPTREQTGSPRGEDTSGYNILNSWEAGYRWRAIDGNYGKYRSDVNFGNGIRLLGSSLRINSKEGQGRFFDELVLTTQGLGNDPYQSANLRFEKNRLYRYDLLWRLNEYYNPALTVSNGLHRMDTRRRFQDHDLTLLPQSAIRFFIGYSRNSQTGPALSTINAFDQHRGDEFPLFMDVRRQRNEYRLGTEMNLAGFKLNILRGWDNFKDDSPNTLNSFTPGSNTTDNTTITSFRRTEPYHGNSPYWRLFLIRNEKKYAINARYANVSARRDFVMDELALGTDRLNVSRRRQILVTGTGSRPVVNGSLNLSLFPTDRLTITNHTAFHNTRMEGDSTYRELDPSSALGAFRSFQFLGIRAIETLTDATLNANRWLGLYGGYHFSTRRIISREGDEFSNPFRVEQRNRLHSGLGGIRLRPVKPLTIQLDFEVGRADRPFFPISEKNYHAINGRVQYKAGNLLLSAMTKTFYNTNSVSLFAHSARSRHHSFDASWTASGWLSIDAGYSKLHLDTSTGLAYFAAGNLVDNNRSLYFSNLHAGNFGARIAVKKRADLYVGYSLIKDTGDGRARASVITSPAGDPFYVAQTFPLTFQSPQARLSIRIRANLRWNAGYQFYGYREDFFLLTGQNYRAHTGFTSLLWSF